MKRNRKEKKMKKTEYMGRPERQTLNYLKRHNPEYIAWHCARCKSRMVENYYLYAQKADRIYCLVKMIAQKAGVPPVTRRLYYTFALELEKLYRRHPERDNSSEVHILRYKWMVRGLDPKLLLVVESSLRQLLGL